VTYSNASGEAARYPAGRGHNGANKKLKGLAKDRFYGLCSKGGLPIEKPKKRKREKNRDPYT